MYSSMIRLDNVQHTHKTKKARKRFERVRPIKGMAMTINDREDNLRQDITLIFESRPRT